MQTTIIITADLGHLKAYAIEQDDSPGAPRIRLLRTHNTDLAQHLSTIVTDQAGRFRKRPVTSVGQTDRSDGEPHNFGIERRKRAIKALANDVNELIARERPAGWCLAVASEINRALLNALNKNVRARMQQNVEANLTGLSKSEVVRHFNLRSGAPQEVDFIGLQQTTPEAAKPSSRVRRVNQGNVPRKPAARRTSPLKQAMRRQTIGAQMAGEMSRLSDKGDRRRSRAERQVAASARSRRLRKRA